MRLEITRTDGLRNDLLLRLDRAEIERGLLSVANRDRLRSLPGMPRHRVASFEEQHQVAQAKVPIEMHLQRMGVTDGEGRAALRAIAISNRNLGTNHGHVAWQRDESPRFLRIAEDPLAYGTYSCLTAWRSGELTLNDLRFDGDRALDGSDGRDLSGEIAWATFGQRILRQGRIVGFEEIAGQFYDARHVLAFDHHRDEGDRIRAAIYDGYPATFRDNVLAAWRAGVPRARYYQNAVGFSRGELLILQREGTTEEIAAALRDAGADDGLLLDNGGSVVCWVWWANLYAGGIVSPTIDYRPPGTSAIAFVLKGPVRMDLPGGSVSYSTC